MPKKNSRAASRRAKPKTARKRASPTRRAKPLATKPLAAKSLATRPPAKPLAKPFHSALVAELESKGANLPELRDIARKAIDQALAGEKEARVFIADRLDGKVSIAAAREGTEEQVTVVIRRFAKDRTPG